MEKVCIYPLSMNFISVLITADFYIIINKKKLKTELFICSLVKYVLVGRIHISVEMNTTIETSNQKHAAEDITEPQTVVPPPSPPLLVLSLPQKGNSPLPQKGNSHVDTIIGVVLGMVRDHFKDVSSQIVEDVYTPTFRQIAISMTVTGAKIWLWKRILFLITYMHNEDINELTKQLDSMHRLVDKSTYSEMEEMLVKTQSELNALKEEEAKKKEEQAIKQEKEKEEKMVADLVAAEEKIRVLTQELENTNKQFDDYKALHNVSVIPMTEHHAMVDDFTQKLNLAQSQVADWTKWYTEQNIYAMLAKCHELEDENRTVRQMWSDLTQPTEQEQQQLEQQQLEQQQLEHTRVPLPNTKAASSQLNLMWITSAKFTIDQLYKTLKDLHAVSEIKTTKDAIVTLIANCIGKPYFTSVLAILEKVKEIGDSRFQKEFFGMVDLKNTEGAINKLYAMIKIDNPLQQILANARKESWDANEAAKTVVTAKDIAVAAAKEAMAAAKEATNATTEPKKVTKAVEKAATAANAAAEAAKKAVQNLTAVTGMASLKTVKEANAAVKEAANAAKEAMTAAQDAAAAAARQAKKKEDEDGDTGEGSKGGKGGKGGKGPTS
jgi:hypothetical protein